MSEMALPTVTLVASASPETNQNFVATRIFINQVPEYENLPSCAEKQVSSVVRNMVDGCGDGSRTTSYACFCYSSSTHFKSVITSRIQDACDGMEQASTAGDVFSKYCQIGLIQSLATPSSASAPPITSASQGINSPTPSSLALVPSKDSILSPLPSSTISPTISSMPTSMVSADPTAPDSLNSRPKNTTIAVSVVVPILVISFVITIFLVFRNRRKRAQAIVANSEKGDKVADQRGERGYNVSSTSDGEPCVELPAQGKGNYHVAELGDQRNRYSVAELQGDGFR